MNERASDDDLLEENATSKLHRILSNADRRVLMAELADEGATPTLADLVDIVVEDPSAKARKRSRIELHHVHLPMLEDAGVLRYDPDEQRVVRTDREHPAFHAPVVRD